MCEEIPNVIVRVFLLWEITILKKNIEIQLLKIIIFHKFDDQFKKT
jgi:hypothetical protein